MADRFDVQGLEAGLADLGGHLDFPATPPLADMVRVRLAATSASRRRFFGPLGRSFLLAAAALVLLAGIAAALGFLVGGVRITFTERTPVPLPSGVVSERNFGIEVSLDEARRRAGFTILVPGAGGPGKPDHIFFERIPVGGTVTLVYAARAGYPADPTGIGVAITEFRGDIGPEVFEKLITTGTGVRRTSVNGQAAYWIAGGEHFFFYRDANGQIVDSSMRLVGDALVFEQSGVTVRIEGAGTLEAAVRLAATLGH
ncbi:MAG: hypothetical protein DLM71_03410 [Chloroflexi bacterium]|nr:MAG: hypothetical protein DLM71_03410 [Chloroflexota bacterium]